MMKNTLIKLTLVAGAIIFAASVAFSQNAGKITKALLEKTEKVEGYKAKVKIKIDIDFLKMKDRTATVTYRKPDKFEIESDGFALLPKNGSNMEYMQILREKHTALFVRKDNLNGKEVSVIKVIPQTADAETVLAEMWIEPDENRLYKVEAYTKNSGSYNILFEYAGHPYDLPDKFIIKFNIEKSNIPNFMKGNLETLDKSDDNEIESTEGKVILDYYDYKILN